LKISWTQKVTNKEMLNIIHEERYMIHQRKNNWIGRVLRHDGPLNRIIEGRTEGKRVTGRKRQQMIDDIMEKKYENMKRTAEDRMRWIERRK